MKEKVVTAAILVSLVLLVLSCGSPGFQRAPAQTNLTTQLEVDLSNLITRETALDVWESIEEYHLHEDIKGLVLSVSGVKRLYPHGSVSMQMVKYYRIPTMCRDSVNAVMHTRSAKIWVDDGVVAVIENYAGAGAECR